MNYNIFKVLDMPTDEDENMKNNIQIELNYSDILQNKLKKTISNNSLNSLIIGKTYVEPTILENINLEKYFSKNDIENAIKNNYELKITDKGLYSISKYDDAEWITQIITNFLKSNNINSLNESIIDGTAGIGGDTISFSKYFKKTISVEINKIHFDVLNNNLKALSINNVKLFCNNFLDILEDLKKESDILFFDPPWGGRSYKNYNYYNLKIGKYQLYEAINILYNHNFKYVILKAPFNLNISMIHNNILYDNIVIRNSKNRNMILIIFY